jgi:hypothetical protein
MVARCAFSPDEIGGSERGSVTLASYNSLHLTDIAEHLYTNNLHTLRIVYRETLRRQTLSMREKEHEIMLAQRQLADAQHELAKRSTSEVRTEVASVTPASREQDLLKQLDDVEDTYQRQISEMQHQLDTVKTENLALCLEMRDVGQLAQHAQDQVCMLPLNCGWTSATCAFHNLAAWELVICSW